MRGAGARPALHAAAHHASSTSVVAAKTASHRASPLQAEPGGGAWPVIRASPGGRECRAFVRRGRSIMLVGPAGPSAKARIEEQYLQFQEQQLVVDEEIDRALPPACLPPTVGAEPFIIRRPVARLVLLDDSKDLHQAAVGANERMTKQDLDLRVSPFLGERNDAAQALEQTVLSDDLNRIQIVDLRP